MPQFDLTDEAFETEPIETPGFMVVVIILLVVYATTSRPFLYTSIGDWFEQIGYGLLSGVKNLIVLSGLGG